MPRGAGLALALFIALPSVFAQTGTLAGRIFDAETGQPLPGANVVLDGTVTGGTSDLEGRYRLSVLEPGPYVVVASMLGYAPARQKVEIAAGAQTQVSFRLAPAPLDLEGVVVSAMRVGAGASTLPVKVTVIPSREVRQQQALTSSPAEIVANVVPSFSPARQKLTGYGESFRGRSPLFLVDGVPQSNPLRDGSRDGFTIDPEVVDRVEVVFGANAVQGLGATGGIINYVTVEPDPRGRLEQRLAVGTTAGDDLDGDGLGWRTSYLASKRIETGAGPVDVLASASVERRGLSFDAAGRPVGIDNVQGDLADSFARNLLATVHLREDLSPPHALLRSAIGSNEFALCS